MNSSLPSPSDAAPAAPAPAPGWLDVVRAKVGALRYGVIQLVIHDGRVTQIESTEKTRLPTAPERPAAAS